MAAELAARIGGRNLTVRQAGDQSSLGELTAGDRSVEAAFRLSYEQLAPMQQRGFRALGLSPTVEFDPLTPAAVVPAPCPRFEEWPR